MIPDKDTAEECLVYIDRENNKKPGTLFSGNKLFDLNTFTTDEEPVSG